METNRLPGDTDYVRDIINEKTDKYVVMSERAYEELMELARSKCTSADLAKVNLTVVFVQLSKDAA